MNANKENTMNHNDTNSAKRPVSQASWDAIAKKIDAITSDPIGWARQYEAHINEVHQIPTSLQYRRTDAELAELAAEELVAATALRDESYIKPVAPVPSAAAHERTHREMGY